MNYPLVCPHHLDYFHRSPAGDPVGKIAGQGVAQALGDSPPQPKRQTNAELAVDQTL
jgi:hypothetical protein